ncbi:hypothetical protein CR513_21745, partial [Mucuna pruriens]
MLKRKLETSLEEARQERWLSDDFSKKARAEKESCVKIGCFLKVADQEMCSKRVERDQITAEKERLKEVVAALKSRGAEREGELHGLQERVLLLEEELKAAQLSKEHLQNQRRYNLLALVEACGKVDEAESQLEELKETLEGWKRRCQDIADEVETQVRAATADAQLWKDRYIKLAWLANQALMNILQRLRATEDMVDPTRTPKEIKEFLEQCRKLKRKLTASHRYHTRSRTNDIEQATEELEQQNAEMRAEMRMEMGQMKEQINKMFEIITRNAAPTPVAATQGVALSTTTLGTPTYPSGFAPPTWNATAENPPVPQEQPGRNNSGAGRGQGSGTGPYLTLGATVYFHPPPESSRVPRSIQEPALLGSDKINALEERMRAIEGTSSHGIDAANLCLVPDIELPADFKVPKFEKYKGSSCPRVHLAMYCRKMAPYTQQDKIP